MLERIDDARRRPRGELSGDDRVAAVDAQPRTYKTPGEEAPESGRRRGARHARAGAYFSAAGQAIRYSHIEQTA